MQWLVEQGHTVFVISWVNPDTRHGRVTWEDYMFEGASAAIDKALEETGQKSLNLVSYCVGGTLAGTLLAWMGKNRDKRVASATFFTAQLDFEDAGELQIFVDENILQVVGEEMEKGYMPADRMANAFNMLRANDLIWGYMVSNYMLGKDPFPFDLLYWNADSTAMPARVHAFYLEEFYIRNAFAKGELKIRGEPVTLADIRGPVYHVATKEDHIAPAASVYRGAKEMTHAEVRFVLSGSGHIAGVVNPPVLGKYQFWTNPDMSEPSLEAWLEGRRGDPGELVARLGRLAEGALGQAGAGARAGGEARGDRAGAGVLCQGALRRRLRRPPVAGPRGGRARHEWRVTSGWAPAAAGSHRRRRRRHDDTSAPRAGSG